MHALELPRFKDRAKRLDINLQAVPADPAMPTEEMLRRVREWQRSTDELAAIIRDADDLVVELLSAAVAEQQREGIEQLVVFVRSTREGAFDMLRKLNPDQAWIWTEDWQRKEREADVDIAAGRTTSYGSSAEFLSALDAKDRELDSSDPHADVRYLRVVLG